MPPQGRAGMVVVRRYHQAVYNLSKTAGGRIGGIWDRVATLDNLDGFAQPASVVSRAAQRRTVDLVAGYLDTMTGELLDYPPLEQVTGPGVRAGAEPLDVYRRAIYTARQAIHDGATFADAMTEGRNRAVSAGETDVMLTQRAAASDLMASSDRITGYRRVPEPGACPFCLLVSGRRYNVDTLMPIHNHCGCAVAPIVGGYDPGESLNASLDVPDGSVTVTDHPELGPVLAD